MLGVFKVVGSYAGGSPLSSLSSSSVLSWEELVDVFDDVPRAVSDGPAIGRTSDDFGRIGRNSVCDSNTTIWPCYDGIRIYDRMTVRDGSRLSTK